nr:hypothetical protein [Thermoanaerobaculia bacterium]
MNRRVWGWSYATCLVAGVSLLAAASATAQEPAEAPIAADSAADSAPPAEDPNAFKVHFGFEGKAHYRDSESFRIRSPFNFGNLLPPGAPPIFLETVNEGQHFELSVLTLLATATWGPGIEAHAKVDFIDLYDRNPTSSDKQVDV